MGEVRELVQAGANHNALQQIGDRSLAVADRLDLSQSIGFFRRRLKLILVIAAATVLVGAAFTLLSGKTYRANATVVLSNDKSETLPQAGDKTAMSNELVNTQVQLITSREMANRVAAGLGLTAGLTPGQKRDLVDELIGHVTVERAGTSYAIKISYDAREAQTAADRANEYARQFANWQMLDLKSRDNNLRELMGKRLVSLRDQAQKDTAALQQYRIANNLLSTTGASLAEQEISTYNQEFSRAKADAAEDQARLATAVAQLQSGSAGDDVGEALNSTVVSSLRQQESQAASTVANLQSKYGTNHPELIKARSQLVEIRSRIDAEISRVISNLKAKVAVSSQRLGSLNGSLSGARSKLTQNNAAMVGLSEVQRTAQASQDIYESYLNRYKQLVATEGDETPNAQILTLSEVPQKPNSPKPMLNLAISLIIGLGLGVIAAYIAEALFQGIVTPDEVEQQLNRPYLASIPLLSSVPGKGGKAATAVIDDPRSMFSESFRGLQTALGQVTAGNHQVIAVTSALPGEGKTVTACCLSHTLAASGKRTILIDCDLRRGGLSRLLNLSGAQNGLVEVLEGTVAINTLHLDDEYTFMMLPLSSNNDDDKEHLLTGQPFLDLLEKLRQDFDHIVLDLPPILPVAVTRILASRADAVVMVARWYKTSRFAIRTALRRLPENEVNVVGVVLSQINLRQRAFFDRNDPTYYYSQYREYYS
jgi:polysaccharide biosynthesis transport protein